ncbi:hypothetical protein D3C85_1482520 [compost metagenome]
MRACLKRKLIEAIIRRLVKPVSSRKGRDRIWKITTAFTGPTRAASEGPISMETMVIPCPSEIRTLIALRDTAKRLVKYRLR